MTRKPIGQRPAGTTTIALFLGFAAVGTLAGCSQLTDPYVPEPIRHLTEPATGGEYLLYRPSSYDRKQAWPLIVACPSSFPDAPHKQIREWIQLAEQYGFLIAVPRLEFAKRDWQRKPTNLPEVLKKNERRLLSTVRHVRAGHNISEDRVLIYGWKRGAAFALNTGMRNPEMFRAIAVTRPKLHNDKLSGQWMGIDHHQPIQVHYDLDDFVMGKHNQKLVAWLRSIGADVSPRTAGAARKSDTADAILFFQETLRKVPWLHIRAFTPNQANPLEVHFKTKGSLSPRQFRWYFGDGDESVVAQPVHVFSKPGTYTVSLAARGNGRGSGRGSSRGQEPGGHEVRRSVTLTVPGPQLRPGKD